MKETRDELRFNQITSAIKDLLDQQISFTDVQVKPYQPFYYRAPRGYVAYSEQIITEFEVAALLHEVCPVRFFENLQPVQEISPPSQEISMTFSNEKKQALINSTKLLLYKNDGQLEIVWSLSNARLRGSFFLFGTEPHIGLSIRYLPAEIPEPGELGLCLSLQELALKHARGLILICGPTGSGKSTTVAALLEKYNKNMAGHVVTLEQPIEYILSPKKAMITQREIPISAPSFSQGVTAVKRLQPSVIFVGEINDSDTAAACVTASLSGHLVFGTLHSSSVTEAIQSLLDMQPAHSSKEQRTNSIASSLVAIQAQTLIPNKEGIKNVLGYEFIYKSIHLEQEIRKGGFHRIENLLATNSGARDGSIGLNESLSRLIKAGTISREDALASTYDRPGLMSTLSK